MGSTVAGVVVFCFGFVVVFAADHFIRPVIIGGAARLPFLWVLLGILGGLETFGIVGLFLGPAVMAALISLWRDRTAMANLLLWRRRRWPVSRLPASLLPGLPP
jgi:predicted PurR-regulated permease PerM